MTLVRITAPHFCAALEYDRTGVVRRAAPILAWTVGEAWSHVQRWANRKGYGWERVPQNPPPAQAAATMTSAEAKPA